MSDVSDAQLEAIKRVVKDSQSGIVWPGTITSASPVEVLLDGQGAPVPCNATDFISLVVGRRCGVIKIGEDLVIIATYGGAQLPALTVTGDLTESSIPTTVASGTGSGSFTNVSGYAALANPAGVVFTTPASGKSRINFSGRLINTSGVATLAYLSVEIRAGGTIGVGGVAFGPSNGVAFGGSLGSPSGAATTVLTGGRNFPITLSPKTVYNVQAMVICTSGSANDADAVTVDVSPEV